MRAQMGTTATALLLAVAFDVAVGTGCADADSPRQPRAQARLYVAAAVPGDTPAAGVRIDLYRCDSSAPIASRQVSFTTDTLAALEGFEHKPVHLARDHSFVHEHWTLDSGCYIAAATPLAGDGEPLGRCTSIQTAHTPIGPGTEHRLLMITRCGERPSDVPLVDGRLNFAPALAPLRVRRLADDVEVCATARDPEADRLQMRWHARTDLGHALHAERRASKQVGATLVECITLPTATSPVDVTVTAVDGVAYASGAFVSYEERHLRKFGVAVVSRARKSVRVQATAESACESPVEAWTYWIRRDGEALVPTDDLSKVRPGDVVEAEVEVGQKCRGVHVELASFDGTGKTVERDGGTYGPGPHVLWVDVPRGAFEVALAVRIAGQIRVLDVGSSSAP